MERKRTLRIYVIDLSQNMRRFLFRNP
ncbi:hypothetical protein AE42_04590, partial [Enterobacter kobei]